MWMIVELVSDWEAESLDADPIAIPAEWTVYPTAEAARAVMVEHYGETCYNVVELSVAK